MAAVDWFAPAEIAERAPAPQRRRAPTRRPAAPVRSRRKATQRRVRGHIVWMILFALLLFGVVAVTNAFLPALRRSAHPRIVNVSSGTGSLTWATGPEFVHEGRFAAYRSSKAALNALTVFYAHSLAGDGIKVNALAPGGRRTDLNSRAAAAGGDPAEAAAGAVRLALLPDDGPTGEFLSWDGTSVPW